MIFSMRKIKWGILRHVCINTCILQRRGVNPGAELQLRGRIDDNSKIIFLISRQKHML